MRQADQNDADDLRPEYTEADFVAGVRGKYAPRFPVVRLTLALECTEQTDGHWLACIKEFPELSATDDSWEKVVDRVEALAVALIAGRVERGEIPPTGLNFAISTRFSRSSMRRVAPLR
jgi:predicted RNase H-like HicB family nuclease